MPDKDSTSPAAKKPAAPAVARKRSVAPKAKAAGEAVAKGVTSVATKVPAKQAVKQPVKLTVKQAVNEAVKAPKSRPKLVRDSFTMPEADFAVIATLKSKALGARRAAKKSELLRAGLRALAALDAKALVAALDSLEAVKTGRPKKGH